MGLILGMCDEALRISPKGDTAVVADDAAVESFSFAQVVRDAALARAARSDVRLRTRPNPWGRESWNTFLSNDGCNVGDRSGARVPPIQILDAQTVDSVYSLVTVAVPVPTSGVSVLISARVVGASADDSEAESFSQTLRVEAPMGVELPV